MYRDAVMARLSHTLLGPMRVAREDTILILDSYNYDTLCFFLIQSASTYTDTHLVI